MKSSLLFSSLSLYMKELMHAQDCQWQELSTSITTALVTLFRRNVGMAEWHKALK